MSKDTDINDENIIEQDESAENCNKEEQPTEGESTRPGKKSSKKNKKESAEKKYGKCREDLAEAERKIAELTEKVLRLNAEFENFRKRAIRERDEVRLNTRLDTVETIVPVLDHFDLALKAAENDHNVNALLEGMKMIKAEFEKALTSLNVEVINSEGKEFDPNIHEAVANEPSKEIEKDKIIKQWRPGYKINNRLIRPATVVVSSGKSEE
ncbi:MAG: nucleotide exchange factor GrpE [Victivallales bacterium]|nr:nucleotide exchange factor GrpE [Victivallales bacterium]